MAVEAGRTGEAGRTDVVEHEELDALTAKRFKVGATLTVIMLVVYFGFILLIAFNKPLLAERLTSGLSLGMLLGVLVILATWVLVALYIRWANGTYEEDIQRLRRR